MSVQFTEGPAVIDSTDFQYTYGGKSVALKVRYIDAIQVATITSHVKTGTSDWVFNSEVQGDFLGTLESYSNVSDWVKTYLVPKINFLFEIVFAGVVPDPSDNVPASLIALDQYLFGLKTSVQVVNGVPKLVVA